MRALDTLLKERYAPYFTLEGFQEFLTDEVFLYHLPNFSYNMSIGDIDVHPVEDDPTRYNISCEVAYTSTTFYHMNGTATMPVKGKNSHIQIGNKDLLLTWLRVDASKSP